MNADKKYVFERSDLFACDLLLKKLFTRNFDQSLNQVRHKTMKRNEFHRKESLFILISTLEESLPLVRRFSALYYDCLLSKRKYFMKSNVPRYRGKFQHENLYSDIILV